MQQKPYNNIRNFKNKNKSKDYDYKKRNNTINTKRPKYQINFDEFILKSEFNTKNKKIKKF